MDPGSADAIEGLGAAGLGAAGLRPDGLSEGGLSAADVAARRDRGQVNRSPARSSRTYAEIVRANVVTRFNAIIVTLAVVVLAVGDAIDAVFAAVMVANIVIGIVQEIRAKRTLDGLRVLIAPTITVRRDGREQQLPAEELVLDDVIRLGAGDQVPVDAVVLESNGLEVDESPLTGEADPVAKAAGDEVLSGSAIVAGGAVVVATRVGEDAWIHHLVAQAKEFVLARSELRTGVDRILRVVAWIVAPLSALLLWSQLRANQSVAEGLVSTVAGVVGLVPQGLVLLISLAMAVSILRLARNHVVVQELYAVEGLARIDVLCVDKTGTLTTGKLAVESIEPLARSKPDVLDALAALSAAEPSPNATMRAMAGSLPPDPHWVVAERHAFSSARKWGGATFASRGTWLLGAPEILLDAMATTPAPVVSVDPVGPTAARGRINELAEDAKRVLLLAHTSTGLSADGALPDDLEAVGLVVLSEVVREDAATTMAYFAAQGVNIKVISGDNPRTVAAVARRLGVAGAERFVDMRTITGALDDVIEQNAVFGRVLPEQKRDLVDALQRAGHVVAMTGDGVNDIPALKRADIAIAMDTATPATKAVSQLVLLDGRFDRLPAVVAEGRRVIANMERVSSLFVTKTVYAALFALTIGISGDIFPFLPRQMSLVSELTIGVPAFVLSFRASEVRSRHGYLRRVAHFSVPAGLAAATVTLGTYWLARSSAIDASLAEARSASTLSRGLIGGWILFRLMRPIDRIDALLLVAMGTALTVILALPASRDFYALEFPPWRDALAIVAVTAASITGLEAALRVSARRSRVSASGPR